MNEQVKTEDLLKYKNGQYRTCYALMIVGDLVMGMESIPFIARKHGIPTRSLESLRDRLLKDSGYLRILEEMKSQDKTTQGSDELARENERLKKALELAMLKVEALEILVDVAEDQFNIAIRKKVGSKQSK